MFVIRPIEAKDLTAYEELAFLATIGITTLPKNKTLLEEKVQLSLESFQKQNDQPNHEIYLFVLEDLSNKSVGGTCALFGTSGIYSSPCFYEVVAEEFDSPLLNTETRVLHPKKYEHGPSEVCGIFLRRDFRHEGLGKLLSLSRFLFIATFPHLFTSNIISSIRGRIDEKGNSPFWNGLGRHFLPVSLKEAFTLLEEKKITYADLLSRYPLPVTLLSQRAQSVIRKPHMNSKPALIMLQKEGFHVTPEIDLLDGGPKLMARQDQIHTVTDSQVAEIGEITKNSLTSPPYLISNQSKNFRACYGNLHLKEGKAFVPANVCSALQVEKGDSIRFLSLRAHEKKEK